jgi:O-antigen/teichoic acid export membrane protein
LLAQNLPIFAMLIVATLLRVGADGYSMVLLGLHRDRAIAIIGLSGAVLSIVLNATLIPVGGLYGAAAAYLVTAASLLFVRVYISLGPTAYRHSQ